MHKCKVCGKTFATERSLHAHLKAHKLRLAEYYQTYYPRHDKHDGNIIKFKNKDYYFENDFNSRQNLRLWLKGQSKPEAKEYCRELLISRKEKLGYGTAVIEGFNFGIRKKYEYIIQMDADLSHRSIDLTNMIKFIDNLFSKTVISCFNFRC